METLDSRKETLLKLTIRRYVKTAEPVGSAWLAEESGLDVSSATIRNELSELEAGGYLVQPHTSAGRIPGELGYRYYVTHFLEKKKPPQETVDGFREALSGTEEAAARLRRAAKTLSEQAHAAALVGFGPRDVYYTGLSNLFSQPEFRQFGQVASMSHVLDHLDDVMEKIFANVDSNVGILIGRENPFGAECGLIIAKVEHARPAPGGGRMPPGIIAILGPMRMDYDFGAGLLETAIETLKN